MANLNVLIVDDEAGIRSGITRVLSNFAVDFPFLEEEFTFSLSECESGEEAIQIIENHPVDIVLLDNKLPGMDGIDVLEHINKKKYDCCVMMITSYASLDLAVQATQNGAYNFVPKPFTPAELKASMESITKHLYLKRMTKNLTNDGKESRFRFLSILSHELKSPINAIEGYLITMQERQAGSNLDDYEVMLNRCIERIKGMRLLIGDLLDLTRLESGKKVRENTKVDLVEIARITKDTVSPLAVQKNVSVNIDYDTDQIFLSADTEEIKIIFNNLISNAVKYNKDGGDVFCNISHNNGRIQISVKDTGIGMSEEDLSKLFGDFVRIKNEKTRAITGSGLGLSITKKIVEESYGGTIKVASVPDQGTTFTVELPVKA